MTDEELMTWGREESAKRKADLLVRTEQGLFNAQRNAETRRKAVGLTRGQAANAVSQAQRQERIDAARKGTT